MSAKGQPKSATDAYVVGINIGGTTCSVVLATSNLNIIDQQSFPTAAQTGVDETMAQFFRSLDKLLANHAVTPDRVQGIGISCGGPLDSKAGLILSPPNLPGWDRVPIVELFEQRYSVPTYLENDANAGALAEWRFGAGQGVHNLIFLTFGTGIGAGLILDGQLYAGTNGMAGEIGHVRLTPTGPYGYGKAGSVEGYCSGGGIAQVASVEVLRAKQAGCNTSLLEKSDHPDGITAKDVAVAAQAGDELAIHILKTTGTYLGLTLSILIDLLNPECIVIGSIYARCEQFIAPAMLAVIEAETLSLARSACHVVPAALGESIGSYAALTVALNGAGLLRDTLP